MREVTSSAPTQSSFNPLPLAKRPQADEFDRPPRLREDGQSRESNLPTNPRLVSHGELAEAAQLQRKAVRVEIVQQSGFERRDHGFHDYLRFFHGRQRQRLPNPRSQLLSTS
jgi:hypothetical protein